MLLHEVTLETLEPIQGAKVGIDGFSWIFRARQLSDGSVPLRLGPQFGVQGLSLLDAESLDVGQDPGAGDASVETGSSMSVSTEAGWAVALFGVPYAIGIEVVAQGWSIAPLRATSNGITTAARAIEFRFGAGAEHVVQPFLVMDSASGTDPDFAIDGLPVPPVFDPDTREAIVLARSGPSTPRAGGARGSACPAWNRDWWASRPTARRSLSVAPSRPTSSPSRWP